MDKTTAQLNQLMTMVETFITQQNTIAERHQEAITALSKRIDNLSTAPAHDQASSSQAPPLIRHAPPPLILHEPPPPVLVRPDAALLPRYSRLEFPTYDGKSDPLGRLTRCEQFFIHQQTSAAERLHLASFHMLDSAPLWASRLLTGQSNLMWEDFKRYCNLRFGPPIRNNPLGELTSLRQTGSVDEYLEQFQLLLAHVTHTPEMQIAIFTAGLRDRLRLDVEFEAPPDLVTAMSVARLYDRRLQLTQEVYLLPNNNIQQGRLEGPPAPPVRRLSRAEMLERRAHGLCYDCDEQYNHRHRCKKLFYLHVEDSDEEGIR